MKLKKNENMPSPRAANSFSLIQRKEGDHELWIFGGNNTQTFLNDMYYYSFKENLWKEVVYNHQNSMAIPTPRSGHSMIYFEQKQQFYMFGGGNNQLCFNDLFVFDLLSKSWLLVSCSGDPPSVRASHSSTKINENCFCIIGGGNFEIGFNDVHLFNMQNLSWTKIKTTGEQPEKRASHSAALVNQKIYIFGGANFDGEPYSDLFSLDLSYMVSAQKLYQEQTTKNIQQIQQASRSSRRRAKKRQMREQSSNSKLNRLVDSR